MDSTTKKIFWNYAGTAGLMLGMISSANMFIGQYLSTLELSKTMITLTGGLLWCAETAGCICLMYFYMKKFALEFPSEERKTVHHLGVTVAFFSALLYSAMTFANMAYFSADYFTAAYQQILQSAAPALDSNSRAMMTKFMENLPQISFFSNLIYCFLFGTIASSIISRSIFAKKVFSENNNDEE
jgi:hypothetical protein